MISNKHIELQNMAARWLRNRSFKMCGIPEFNAVGYVADFFAIAGMHDEHHTRYTKASGLTKQYMSSRSENGKCVQKIFGDIDRWYACIFEVKVSRADFLNTFGNRESIHSKARKEPVGTAHWVIAERGICQPKELPDLWGLLIPYGSGLTEKKMPQLNVLPESTLHAFAFELLWLQMNYRPSYYCQMTDMAEKIRRLHRAIITKKPQCELLRCSNQVIKTCRGM